MSTYWFYECQEHEPVIRSDEFTQHTDDDAYRLGMTLAASRPLDHAWWDGDQGGNEGYFERNARSFLEQHPTCRLEAVSEYGDRVRIERPVPTTDEDYVFTKEEVRGMGIPTLRAMSAHQRPIPTREQITPEQQRDIDKLRKWAEMAANLPIGQRVLRVLALLQKGADR